MSIHSHLTHTINTVEGAEHLAEIHWRRDNHPRHFPPRSLRDLLEASSQESASDDQSTDSEPDQPAIRALSRLPYWEGPRFDYSRAREIDTPRYLRNPFHHYTIRTYTSALPLGTEIDQEFTFRFEKGFSHVFIDQLFRAIHPNSDSVTGDIRSRYSSKFKKRGTRNVKLYILRGVHKGQPGVILSSRYSEKSESRSVHRILLGDGSIVSIPQENVRLLDPSFILPFGIPVFRDL